MCVRHGSNGGCAGALRAECLLIEIGIEYIQMTMAAEATVTNKGRAVINSDILNAERAGERGGRRDPDGSGGSRA
jgi:hypothetical protein